jgi:hypothetical protein
MYNHAEQQPSGVHPSWWFCKQKQAAAMEFATFVDANGPAILRTLSAALSASATSGGQLSLKLA